MAQATISVRIDENDKIPFEISQSVDPFYSESNQAHLMKSIKELREGKGTVHELIEVDYN